MKTVPAIVMSAEGMPASPNTATDDPILTVMDGPTSAEEPFEGNLNVRYLAWSGNTKSSSLVADTTMTWCGQTATWSLWGSASNTSSNDERSSEEYAADGRSRFNLTDYDYLSGQASWLTGHYNGYREHDVLTTGYGRQFLNGPVHSFRFELGPDVCYDKYTDNASETQPLGYVFGIYAWQLTDSAKFTQDVSVFDTGDITLNSESALNVATNEHFGPKVAYNVIWNSEPPESTSEYIDRQTVLSLGYSI